MRLILLMFLVVSLSGCAIFSGKSRQSQWQVLENSNSVSCYPWPNHPRIMNVQELKVLGTDKVGFLAKVTQRNGGTTSYYANFTGSGKIKTDALELREFGSGAIFAGGGSRGGQVYAVVIPTVKNPGVLEVRSMEDNVVRFFGKGLPTNLRSAKSYWAKNGIWLLYRAGDAETATDDMRAKLAFAQFVPGKQELKLTIYPGRDFPGESEVLIDTTGKAFVAWLDQKTDTKKKTSVWFNLTEVDGEKRAVNPVRTIGLPLRSEVESWRLTAYGDGALAAVVDGDSLVGQASLRVASIEWSSGVPTVKWTKEASLTNEHVSLPNWGVRNRTAFLLLPKWVDEESTIATYKIGSEGIIEANASGVFSKGSRVMEVFIEPGDDDVYAVVRTRARVGWRFEICNLGEL